MGAQAQDAPALLADGQALLRRVWRFYAGRLGHEPDRGYYYYCKAEG